MHLTASGPGPNQRPQCEETRVPRCKHPEGRSQCQPLTGLLFESNRAPVIHSHCLKLSVQCHIIAQPRWCNLIFNVTGFFVGSILRVRPSPALNFPKSISVRSWSRLCGLELEKLLTMKRDSDSTAVNYPGLSDDVLMLGSLFRQEIISHVTNHDHNAWVPATWTCGWGNLKCKVFSSTK